MGIITVTNLGKAYKYYPTRWSQLAEWVTPSHRPQQIFKWVLQEINFAVSPGGVVGFIGINCASKSNLHKMIVGTAQPTSGCVNITGRVATLLEHGMGLHPVFTGWQNSFLAGNFLAAEWKKLLD
jgi:lipopolysaccharide transport system ATP-binding protein